MLSPVLSEGGKPRGWLRSDIFGRAQSVTSILSPWPRECPFLFLAYSEAFWGAAGGRRSRRSCCGQEGLERPNGGGTQHLGSLAVGRGGQARRAAWRARRLGRGLRLGGRWGAGGENESFCRSILPPAPPAPPRGVRTPDFVTLSEVDPRVSIWRWSEIGGAEVCGKGESGLPVFGGTLPSARLPHWSEAWEVRDDPVLDAPSFLIPVRKISKLGTREPKSKGEPASAPLHLAQRGRLRASGKEKRLVRFGKRVTGQPWGLGRGPGGRRGGHPRCWGRTSDLQGEPP